MSDYKKFPSWVWAIMVGLVISFLAGIVIATPWQVASDASLLPSMIGVLVSFLRGKLRSSKDVLIWVVFPQGGWVIYAVIVFTIAARSLE